MPELLITLAIIIGKSLLLIAALLVFIAYILYADRKIWAAVQLRRGPNVVGPWGLLQSFADLLKFVLRSRSSPPAPTRRVPPARPAGDRARVAGGVGGHPVSEGWAIADINVGILYVLAVLVARRLRDHHGRLGLELEVSLPRRAALGGADGVLRGLHRLRHHHRAPVRRLAEPDGHRQRAAKPLRDAGWYWLPLFPMFVIFFIRRSPRRTGRPSICRKPSPSSWRASWSSTRPRRTCCSCSASTWRS